MDNIEKLEQRLSKKYEKQINAIVIFDKLQEDILDLEKKFNKIFEASGSSIEFGYDANQDTDNISMSIDGTVANIRLVEQKGEFYIVVDDSSNRTASVILQITSADRVTPLDLRYHDNRTVNYTIHKNEILDFIIGVVYNHNNY
ncbi:hypothetical protein [Bacillus haynesii]|uniref:hypothetical protein n=1 Tax=Bacillus haynesii TaxID=1925021 RepID=UPI00227F3DC6|nr:hypothetical protein [Bacillus haynesii]MCY9451576.1 hypothetical protein [Bacillus haynesii]